MNQQRPPFQVKKKGEDIRSVGVKDTVDPGITYSFGFAEWQACVGVGLDLWAWESGEYPRWFKIRVIGYYNMSNLVGLHTQSEISQKSSAKGSKR